VKIVGSSFVATPIDPNEAEGLIPSISTQDELNEFEERNIAQASAWAISSRKLRKELLTIDGLTLLHSRMFHRTWRWAGKFRTTQKSIGIEAFRITTELTNLCADVQTWRTHATYSPDEIAARFHHRLVSIHPFPNGNGRHARLAADLLIRQLGGKRFSWGSSATLTTADGNRTAYVAALQAADRHDLGPLIAFARG